MSRFARSTVFPQLGLVQGDEIEQMIEQMMQDIIQKDFSGLTYGLTVWGINPAPQ